MTLQEAINEAKIGALLCKLKGNQELAAALTMAVGAFEQEQARRPHNFDFEDVKLPGETQ